MERPSNNIDKTGLLTLIRGYKPIDEIDALTRMKFEELILSLDNPAGRESMPGHLTASAFILNRDGDKLLLIHHRKLDRWLQPGGHIENDNSLMDAALREVFEETGIRTASPLSTEIFDLDIHLIPAGKKEPEHFHYDVRYLFRISDDEIPSHDPNETKGLKWYGIGNIITDGFEESFQRVVKKITIYQAGNSKISF